MTIAGIRVKGDDVPEANPEALEAMQESPYNFPTTRWAAYENHALDSSLCGELRFLAVGPQNTYQRAPDRYPDSHLGTGWRYVHIGWVNLKTGAIDKDPPATFDSLVP